MNCTTISALDSTAYARSTNLTHGAHAENFTVIQSPFSIEYSLFFDRREKPFLFSEFVRHKNVVTASFST